MKVLYTHKFLKIHGLHPSFLNSYVYFLKYLKSLTYKCVGTLIFNSTIKINQCYGFLLFQAS